MRRTWSAAPVRVRWVAAASWLLFVPLVLAQIIAANAVTRRVRDMMLGVAADPFAALNDEKAPVAVDSVLERFSSGFSMSMTATFSAMVILSGMRLLRPYRNRALSVLFWSAGLQTAWLSWIAFGLFTGARPFNAGTVGTFCTLLSTIPVVWLASDATVRAWSVRFEPPPPPLP